MKQFTLRRRRSEPSTLVVLEERPFWFAELQRRLGPEAISVRLRCRAEDVWESLKTGHVRMLVIGADVDLPAVLRLLIRLADHPFSVRSAVLVAPETRELEWSLRELGAVDILQTPFEIRGLVDIVRREFRQG